MNTIGNNALAPAEIATAQAAVGIETKEDLKDAQLDDLPTRLVSGNTPPAGRFDHLTRWEAIKVFWRPTMMCFFSGICILMEGYQGSITGNIVSNKGFIEQFGSITASGQKALDAQYVSAWGGTTGVAQLLGQQISTLIADRFGRRVSFLLATVLIILGVFLEMFVTTIAGWLGAKIVAGFAAGMGQAIGLLYIAEIAPSQNRGALLCCYALFLALGQLTSAIALQIINVTQPYEWRKAIYSEWVLVGLFAVCLPWMYESPWFYARKGSHEAAKVAMAKIYGDVKGYDVEHEYGVMRNQLELENEQRRSQKDSSFKEIFMGVNLKRTAASFFGVVMLQWSGASVVFSYATYFLQQAGIQQPFQATCIVYSLLAFMVCVSFYTTDRFGRRALIFTGGIGCFVCNLILGTLGVIPRTDAVLNATLGVICIWVIFYAGCLAGVGWGLTSEIATPRLRARTAGVVINGSQCFSIMFGYTVPLMLSATGPGARNWGVKTLYLFACTGGVGTVINYFLLPEVRGRTYAELDEIFQARIPARHTKAFVSQKDRAANALAA